MTKIEYDGLVTSIRHHMDLYYNLNEPEISDYEYDMLMQALKAAEKEHPEWVTPDSPSQVIGGVAKREAGEKVQLSTPLLSIQDVFTYEDVAEWIDKIHEMYPDCSFSVEQKIDGLTMSTSYSRIHLQDVGPNHETEPLRLYLATTRGDGEFGENVTANAMVISDVKKTIDVPCESIELRGEVYMTHASFFRYNEAMEEAGKKTAANPRNLAAGALRQLDPKITKERQLSFFIFNVQAATPKDFMRSHTKALDILSAAGVPVVYHKLCRTKEEVLNAIIEIGEMRASLPYDIDGAVVKLDDTTLRADFPAGSKYSAGHIAYKYPPEEKVVSIDQIEMTVGRTGRIGFVGHVSDAVTGKPVRLCGTDVSRVTLHNLDYIEERHVGIGGKYLLKKSGDIIPKLGKVVEEPDAIFRPDLVCPICGEPLLQEEETADIRCISPSCPAQLTRTIAYFCGRSAMNIIGLGETLIDALVAEGYLKDYADIYFLKNYRDELVKKGTIGKEKNTDKLLRNIEESKANSPVQLLTGLGIRNVGAATARTLLGRFHSIQELAEASEEQLSDIQDIGPTTAKCIRLFFEAKKTKELIEKLLSAGVNMTMHESEPSSGRLGGLTIVVTGSLKHYDRKKFEDLIVRNGGKASSSVSKKTSYLVAGENAGSKLTKAIEHGVPVVSEEEFLKMLSSDN